MTEVFPKLGGLPQHVIDQMLVKANDGKLHYPPIQKMVRKNQVHIISGSVHRTEKF